ncbi:MBL fold metallo-hydrolase [Legionella israelensis]|uniref:Ribonuclease Z n=1 Tax=Legionella israelensis TaxID=454 RepID=A0A0W0V6Y8_9GAMM|nr:MBL fold metallo-hydrolase [Legionella israelensis]KTD15867.1 ribonuclease Z [Legionella israelensis]QBS09189.1 MBL fold metallo-hydrolase [Legionella israelensis]SCY22771.1 Ribonuclease BN, tRNA processing enzyme [Legionella israelensis DSM 19235]STX58925.1 ribonuclease Z [Legionella israelensis]
MKIKILGTRGEIEPSAPYHSHQSGVLVENKLLFDCGESEFLQYHPDVIFITHLHPDHAYFVREPGKEADIKIPLYAPETFKGKVNVQVLDCKKEIDSFEIIPIPTHHSHKVKSQAYLIKKNKEKILYTGDMIWINREHHQLLTDLDLVITEASFIRKGGRISKHKESEKLYGHTGIPNLLKFFNPFTKHICLVHFGSWFYKDIEKSRKKLKEYSKAFNIHIHVGYDGMELNTQKLEE